MATPKLRFDGFSGNWVTTQLGNVCSFTQGVQIPQSEQINEERDGYIRYLYIRDFFSDKFKCYVPNIYPEKIIHPHEIMMVNTGNTTGEAYTGRYGVLSNNSFKISYDLAHFNDQFMYLFCSSELAQNQIKKFFNAGGQPHLGHKNISQILISYPKKEEQTKIASFLSAVDEKISQLNQKHELLSQYKQGMMQKLFSQQIRFKADDDSEFGEWEEIQLRDVAERVTRKNKEDNQNALTISAQMGLVNQQDYFSKQIASRDLSKYYLLHKGEFAYNKSYSAGYPMGAIKRLKLYEKGVVSTLYICFALNDQLNANFFEQYVESGALVPELEKIAQEGARNHGLLNISLQEFFEVVILKPCLEEQTKIANFLSAIDQKIEGVAQQIEQAKLWKKGLLQQMFV